MRIPKPTRRSRGVPAMLAALMLAGTLSAQPLTGLVLSTEFTSAPARRPKTVFPAATFRAPEVDGSLDDACWARAARHELLSEMGAVPASRATFVRVCRDDNALYIAFECQEPAVVELPLLARTPDTWSDENVSLYISRSETLNDFYVFSTDPNGTSLDMSLQGGLKWTAEWQVKAQRTTGGWTAEMAIPFKSLGVRRIVESETWRINFCRRAALSGERCSWEPTAGNPFNPDRWGQLYFGDVDAWQRQPILPRVNLYPDRWQVGADDKTLRLVVRMDLGALAPEKARLRLSVLADPRTEPRPPLPAVLPVKGERASLILNSVMLPIGPFALAAELLDADGGTVSRAQITLRRETGAPSSAPAGQVELLLPPAGLKGAAVAAWPVTAGVAFAPGAIHSPANIRLVNPQGEEVRCRAVVRGRWPADGSIRWLGLHLDADLTQAQGQKFILQYGPQIAAPAVRGFTRQYELVRYDAANMYIAEREDAWWVNTGSLLLNVNHRRYSGIEESWVDVNGNGQYDYTEQILNATAGDAGPYAVDAKGNIYRLSADPDFHVQLEDWNELRLTLRGEGRLLRTGAGAGAAAGLSLGRCVWRLHAYAGKPFLRVQYTFHFDERTAYTLLSDLGVMERLQRLPRGQRYEAVFGTPETFRHALRDTGGIYLQKLMPDEFLLQSEKDAGIEQRGTGAANWAAAAAPDRGVMVCLQDMGQLHPKALEVTDDSRVLIHFWPPHGTEKSRALRADPNRRTAGALGFAHFGRWLDMSVPGAFAAGLKDRVGLKDFAGVQDMDVSDPTGVALTYDVLYYFYGGTAPVADFPQIARAFELRPQVVQAPQALAASGALAETLSPARAARAVALTERLLHLETARGFTAGDFNYMDVHANWLPDEDRYDLRGYWLGNRTDLTAALWTLYMQTGSPVVQRAAERNLRHVLAVDLCNTASPAQALHADPRRRKIAGAFGNHRTPVHWQSACHVNDRHARLKGLLLAYYLLGDLCARDAAQAWAAAARAYGVPTCAHDGMAYLQNLSGLLLMDYDSGLQERLGECSEYMFRMPYNAEETAPWVPGARDYFRRTHDPRAADFLQAAAAAAPKDVFALLGLFRDAQAVAGHAESGQVAQRLIADFEQKADKILAAPVNVDDALTWQDLCVYIFGAAEPSVPSLKVSQLGVQLGAATEKGGPGDSPGQ